MRLGRRGMDIDLAGYPLKQSMPNIRVRALVERFMPSRDGTDNKFTGYPEKQSMPNIRVRALE